MEWQESQTTVTACVKDRRVRAAPQPGQFIAFTCGVQRADWECLRSLPSLESAQILELQVFKLDGFAKVKDWRLVAVIERREFPVF